METPPVGVRFVAFCSYSYSWYLGFVALTTHSAEYAKAALITLTAVYLVDAALAACPLHWCNMRGIPPANIVKHHVPFAVALFPNVVLIVLYEKEFTEVLQRQGSIITAIAAGNLTSSNEALWVASSFFSQRVLDSKAYKIIQKLSSIIALSEVRVFLFFFSKKNKKGFARLFSSRA